MTMNTEALRAKFEQSIADAATFVVVREGFGYTDRTCGWAWEGYQAGYAVGIAHVHDAMEMAKKAIDYYRAGLEHRAPQWVPSRVRLCAAVRGDPPLGHASVAEAGEHDCECNQWGAVSVLATDGKMLGIRPSEFEPVAWRENAGGGESS